jgi:secreted PhoX family phosphatase
MASLCEHAYRYREEVLVRERARRSDTTTPPGNHTFAEVLAARLARRGLLRGALASALLSALSGCAARAGGPTPRLSFTPIEPSVRDALRVPREYVATVLLSWGEPVGAPAGSPGFRFDASNTAADQALQAGMHHDGMHYFPLPHDSGSSTHGLLALNHEYLDEGLLFADGQRTWSPEKVAKAQHAVGVSVVEVELQGNTWRLVRPSPYARRITARSPCRIGGPAAGHALVRTAADPEGRRVLGTFNGCAHGWTPWGTYLTCEENWHALFVNRGTIPTEQRRYGITAIGRRYRWEEYDERFDAARHPNEPNRFGWVVEIDPYDPAAEPVKRTALGRMAHEGAACAVGPDRRPVLYMADDAAFEYVYKFVATRPFDPSRRQANRDLLDDGTLYAARFNADGSGDWLPLVHGWGPLDAAGGFRDQGEVVVMARRAADLLGATGMDHPEWIVAHPVTREVFCACTGSSTRGRDGHEGANPANRRAPNPFGHILRWREDGGDPAATRFRWEVLVQAGGPDQGGTITGDLFANPDALWIDSMGTLWVGTDVWPGNIGTGPFEALGNNQLLAVDPSAGAFKRFMTGPRGSEITGFHTTPDNRTAFVNIQHPGEVPGGRSNPDDPRAVSNWPDYWIGGRPRSATVAIRRRDGGVVGT